MIIDLQDDRRAKKTWLPHPGDDRDVTNGLVTEGTDGRPRCWRHGAMNRVDPVRRIYRCSEFRCGVGAEVVPDPRGAWDAFWAEVERAARAGNPGVLLDDETVVRDEAYWTGVVAAVGRGAPSVLLGTSARSLKKNLAELRETTGT
jgi:hypothetical protein